jgi:hypothetical protein
MNLARNVEKRKDRVERRYRATVRYGHGRRWRGRWRFLRQTAIEDAQAFKHFRDTGSLYKLRGL